MIPRPFALAFPLTLHSLVTAIIPGSATALATAVVIAQQTGETADQTDGDDDWCQHHKGCGIGDTGDVD